MPKNKRPAPRTSNNPRPPQDDSQARVLSGLALDLAEREEEYGRAAIEDGLQQLAAQVRKILRRERDGALMEAIEQARYTDPLACRLLRDTVEEQAASLRLAHEGGREGGVEFDIDAFMVPLFVKSAGGLAAGEAFTDDAAFEALAASFARAGLESGQARVVIVRHAYTLAQVERIGYAMLQTMLREAAANLVDKKPKPAPTIAASMSGDEPAQPALGAVLELRFLLGFSLKRVDDPFYAVPGEPDAADAYFDARMARFRAWSSEMAPVLAQCLAPGRAGVHIDFLYQDLFYGARATAQAELALLEILSEARSLLGSAGHAPQAVHAVLAPLEMDENYILRVNFYAEGADLPLGSVDKPVDLSAELADEVDELADALGALDLAGIAMAAGFDPEGRAEGVQPL